MAIYYRDYTKTPTEDEIKKANEDMGYRPDLDKTLDKMKKINSMSPYDRATKAADVGKKKKAEQPGEREY